MPLPKPRFHHVAAVIVLLVQAGACALESPAWETGIPTLTRPPSSYSEGTVIRGAEWTIPGNLAVTGNVTGGKHLQSVTPYTDTSRLQTPLSTALLDSFYRQAATSFQAPQYDAPYVPFYSSTVTTARSRIQQSAPLAPTETAAGVMSQPHGRRTPNPGLRSIPGSVLPPLAPSKVPVSKFWQDTLTQVRRDYGADVAPEVWERLARALAVPNPEPPVAPAQVRLTEPGPTDPAAPAAEDADTAAGEGRMPGTEPRWESPAGHPAWAFADVNGPVDPVQDRDPGPARPGDLDAHRRSQCDAWLAIGEAYLQKREFARAADAFSLAAQYRVDEAQALAGKSFALLCLEEYTRSAWLLGRTLGVMPTYAEYPTILPLVLGDAQVKKCLNALQRSVTEMPTVSSLFLLGYVHYQLGDLELSRQVLQSAQAGGGMPGLPTLLSVVQARLDASRAG
jgi:hypothetical protein